MCSSSNQSQKSSHTRETGRGPHWRPWEEGELLDSNNSHNPPYSDSLLKCGYDCNVTFKRESELKRHTLSKHLKRREHCQVCGKVFTRKDNLTRHMKLAHTSDEKPYCRFCYKSLSRRDAVQRHESTCPKNPSKKTEVNNSELGQYPSHLERLKMKYQKSQECSPANVKVKKEMSVVKTDIGSESGC